MKKILLFILATAIILSLSACGNTTETATDAEQSVSVSTGIPEVEVADEEVIPEEAEITAEPEPEAEPEIPVVEVAMGDTLTLDNFVEFTFSETGIEADIQRSITTDIVTRTSGPQPLEGQKYVYIRGTIKNLSTSELPIYDFFLGQFDIDGYQYDITTNDCSVISSDGQSQTMLPPLTEYEFTMYAAVPDELADDNTDITYRFGFYDAFDNMEMSRNQAFEDDPISLCPYQYSIVLKQA